MNLLLHGIGWYGEASRITVRDVLAAPPDRQVSLVLSHPPYGWQSTIRFSPGSSVGDDAYLRDDFVVRTSSKQVNFLQHIMSLTATNGRAAVVVPDNVLFERGSAEKVRRHLLHNFDLHTLLRLPPGVFHASGVLASVLFFEKPQRSELSPSTSTLWLYDFRSGQSFSPRDRRIRRADLDEFVAAYLPGRPRTDRVHTEHFQRFDVNELLARDHLNLDLSWRPDTQTDLSEESMSPEGIAQEIVEDLEAALTEFASLADELSSRPTGTPPWQAP